ncbi:MAG: polysaccharide deacetylase family protein [Chitinophagaceae bacterium]|nr:polysaccharide deacetylase family protein [Chitinophagaceae bacterium]
MKNFLFHRINPKRDKLWDPMDVPLFEKCIRHITQKYSVFLFEDIAEKVDLLSNNKVASIMFDDGYKDNIEFALPILEKYNCKASFYVVTDCIDKNIPTWTHILEYSFQNTKNTNLLIDFDFVPRDLHVKKLDSPEQRLGYVRKIKPFLKTIPSSQRELVLKRIRSSFDDVQQEKIMMDWDDLKQIIEKGHYVGSHTVTHNMLATISNEEEIKFELMVSGNRIKEKLGYFPKTISYPIGSYNEVTKRIAKETGYQIGLAVKQDVFNPYESDIFEVPRIELYNEPWWKTKMRISNRLEQLKKIIQYR